MEKSLLSFATQYPAWEPEAAAKQLLNTLSLQHPLHTSPHFPYTAYAEQLHSAIAPGACTALHELKWYCQPSDTQLLSKPAIQT